MGINEAFSENNPAIPLLSATIAVDTVEDNGTSFQQTESDLKAREEALLAQMLESSSSAAKETPHASSANSLRVKKVDAPTPPPEQVLDKAVEEEPTSAAILDLERLKGHPAINRATKNRRTVGVTATPEDTTRARMQSGEPAQRLAIAESQVSILSRELDTTRRSLRSAEDRIDELSALVRDSYRTKSGSTTQPQPVDRGDHYTQGSDLEARSHTVPIRGEEGSASEHTTGKRTSEIATIATDRAPLRIGPGRLESALFVLPRNTQVTVERRTGDWFRVLTSSGMRGWIHGPTLIFAAGISPDSAVRIRAAQTANEPTRLKY
jgi:hypothetical protein